MRTNENRDSYRAFKFAFAVLVLTQAPLVMAQLSEPELVGAAILATDLLPLADTLSAHHTRGSASIISEVEGAVPSRYDGRSLAVVSLGHATLDLEKWSNRDERAKTYWVLVDVQSGIVLEVLGVLDSDDYDKMPHNSGVPDSLEGVHGVPTIAPSLTLSQALNEHFFGSPLLADFIWARYVLYKCGNEDPSPAWLLNLSGFPPMFGDDKKGPGVSSWITAVDAVTGKVLHTSNVNCSRFEF